MKCFKQTLVVCLGLDASVLGSFRFKKMFYIFIGLLLICFDGQNIICVFFTQRLTESLLCQECVGCDDLLRDIKCLKYLSGDRDLTGFRSNGLLSECDAELMRDDGQQMCNCGTLFLTPTERFSVYSDSASLSCWV